ncbi:MAG: hypothetical protein J7M12_03080 [Candidatus Hydrogenedentes bacterium]|nr:hypothetical protein [Candidatus Hydrogenedentota bacterium]
MNTRSLAVTVGLSLVLVFGAVGWVHADGTETLGVTPIEQGSHVVAAGTGLHTQPGTITLAIPADATIKQVLLYWEGQHTAPTVGDDTLIINGTEILGTLIGGPTVFFSNVQVSTYRADITRLDLVVTGTTNVLTVTGAEFEYRNDGAGILVVYDDGSRTTTTELRDGQDLAFYDFAPPLDTTVPQTYTFDPTDSDRTAELTMFFGSVSDDTQWPYTARPNRIEITVDGVLYSLVDSLASNDGLEWDTLTTTVLVPAGATTITIQALSASDGGPNMPASLSWIASSLTLETAPPCTGAIGDFVWDDLNGNGIQDADEPGITGVTVNLNDETGAPIATTVTGAAGEYLFEDLCAGVYAVAVDESTLPAGYVPTLTNVGDPAKDSDVNPVTVVLPDDSSQDLTIDFGYLAEEECGPCDGKVSELTLRYLGDKVDAHIVVTGKKKKKDPAAPLIFDGIVQPGETFAFIGYDKNGTLGTEINLTINGSCRGTTIHTSCSQPIGVGMIFGPFEVVAGASRNGGPLCEIDNQPPDEPECGPCDGKVTELSLMYLGDQPDTHVVVAMKAKKGGRRIRGHRGRRHHNTTGQIIFDGIVQPGDIFSFHGADDKGTMGTEITVTENRCTVTKIHTSCSQPIGVGSVFGNFQVVSGASRNGGELCPLGDDQPDDVTAIDLQCEINKTIKKHHGRGDWDFRCIEDIIRAVLGWCNH